MPLVFFAPQKQMQANNRNQKLKLKAKSRDKAQVMLHRETKSKWYLQYHSVLYIDNDEQSKLVIKPCFSSSFWIISPKTQNNIGQAWEACHRVPTISPTPESSSEYFGITK